MLTDQLNANVVVLLKKTSPPPVTQPSPHRPPKTTYGRQPSPCLSPPVTSQPSLHSIPPADNKAKSQLDVLPPAVRGSFNQNDRRFLYAGLQCMAISLVALAKHTVSSVFSWEQRHLDRVLKLGDELYKKRRLGGFTKGLLLVSELPTEWVVDGRCFRFAFSDSLAGDVNVEKSDMIDMGLCVTLDCGLEQVFALYDTCLFTLGGTTCAVIKQNVRYAVVDSHSRGADGLVHYDGKSVVVYFKSIDAVSSHFSALAGGYEDVSKPFEITGVNVVVADGYEGFKEQSSPRSYSFCYPIY
ncbi:uncharacterized protein [Eucyclogobius newberryi]|uniref:uncharacterized protein n=1 Tax=Eucyclogobius newberryi TaxID=166745 RepID=UPI003B5A5BAA